MPEAQQQELLWQLLASPQGSAGLSSVDSGLLRSIVEGRLQADSPRAPAGSGARQAAPGGSLPQAGALTPQPRGRLRSAKAYPACVLASRYSYQAWAAEACGAARERCMCAR